VLGLQARESTVGRPVTIEGLTLKPWDRIAVWIVLAGIVIAILASGWLQHCGLVAIAILGTILVLAYPRFKAQQNDTEIVRELVRPSTLVHIPLYLVQLVLWSFWLWKA
jgi:hypothetical protein